MQYGTSTQQGTPDLQRHHAAGTQEHSLGDMSHVAYRVGVGGSNDGDGTVGAELRDGMWEPRRAQRRGLSTAQQEHSGAEAGRMNATAEP